jgi:hypothetical protein
MMALVQHAATGVRDPKFFGDETLFLSEYVASGVGAPLPAGGGRNTLGHISIVEGAPMCPAPPAPSVRGARHVAGGKAAGASDGAPKATLTEPRPSVVLRFPAVAKKPGAAQPFRLAAEKMFVLTDYERIGSVALGVLGLAFVFFLVFARRVRTRKPVAKGVVPRVLRPPPELPSQVV